LVNSGQGRAFRRRGRGHPGARQAFLHQAGGEPGKLAGFLARITHAGYHQPSAQDASRKIAAFFGAHLKTKSRRRRDAGTRIDLTGAGQHRDRTPAHSRADRRRRARLPPEV
jgi:hypothetical protein